MKAKELLRCLCSESANLESGIDYVTINEYFDFETFFGRKSPISISLGEYVYIWSDVVDNFHDKTENIIKKNAALILDVGDGYSIYLIRLDD